MAAAPSGPPAAATSPLRCETAPERASIFALPRSDGSGGRCWGLLSADRFAIGVSHAWWEKAVSRRAAELTVIIVSCTIKGFAMDDERLKNDGSIPVKKHFEE